MLIAVRYPDTHIVGHQVSDLSVKDNISKK